MTNILHAIGWGIVAGAVFSFFTIFRCRLYWILVFEIALAVFPIMI